MDTPTILSIIRDNLVLISSWVFSVFFIRVFASKSKLTPIADLLMRLRIKIEQMIMNTRAAHAYNKNRVVSIYNANNAFNDISKNKQNENMLNLI